LRNRSICIAVGFTIENTAITTLVTFSTMLFRPIDISCFEVLIRQAITIIVKVVTKLLSGFWSLAEPSQGSVAHSTPVATPKAIAIGAGLGSWKSIIHETVAIIVDAVTSLHSSSTGVTRAPPKVCITSLESVAKAYLVIYETGAL